MGPRRLPQNSRKLLVAAIGVASVSYVACGMVESPPTSGNLMPPQGDSGVTPDPTVRPPTSGNLVAPYPVDSSADANEPSDAGDDAADADASDP